ncbi:hypothetical protein AAFF_G00308220 [Aldrovandia affinis]|uniref:T-box domain-containing protein n=1 Tax=Aldrovandia affinis TaxID=143900 RepID=A0AAD7SNQ2_9TELE|nr:hypothetical protein AAFF_G00308220 [Aldrovandia affinis]
MVSPAGSKPQENGTSHIGESLCRALLLFVVSGECFEYYCLYTFYRNALCGQSYFSSTVRAGFPVKEMSGGRRSAAALSSRAHAFSVEALIGTNKKRKLRGWEEKELELSMESLAANGQLGDQEATAHCLDTDSDSEASPSSDSEGLADRTSCSFGSPSDLRPAPSPPSSMEDIQVQLQCAELWKRFHDIGTEMIITKAGRRMFPAMRVKVLGLNPHRQYYIAMDIVPVENKRYRYVYHSSKWMVAGNADSPVPPRVYLHPDLLASGDTWMRQVISFDKLKLTNNELEDQGHIILHSMHKYQPRVHVIRKDYSSELSPTKPIPTGEGVVTFSFPETVFTTVTAYQNQQITRLKIDRNPFAKGFRDSGRNRWDPSSHNGPLILAFERTGLEAIMESCAFWRAPVRSVTFENFTAMQKQPGGSTGSSPTASSTGTPSPSGSTHLLSPSCSPTTFHLTPRGFGVSCRENQLCSLGLSDYPPCNPSPAPGPTLHGYGGLADTSYGRLQTVSASPSDSSLPKRTSSLFAAAMQGPAHTSGKADAYGGQLGSYPASQLQYVMQARGGANPCPAPGPSHAGHMFGGGGGQHTQQGSYSSFPLHNPYGLYGYGLHGSPRLSANGNKLPPQGPPLSPSHAGGYADRQYPAGGMDMPTHTFGSPSGSQEGAMGYDGRQYSTPSHMPWHMV